MKRKEVLDKKVEQLPSEESSAELDDVDGLFEDLTSTSSD